MGTLNPEIFREYDIRGIADRDLDGDGVRALGRAIGTRLLRDGAKTIVLGRDCRLSSPRIRDALCEGLLDTGLSIIDVGVVPTPLVYFAIRHFRVDGGVQITGSHNAAHYNGFKVCSGERSIHGAEIQELRTIIEAGAFAAAASRGRVRMEDVVTPYQEFVAHNARLSRTGLRVVIDCGNGTAGPVALPLLRRLGLDVIELFPEMDGRFPNHHPDPTEEKNLEHLITRVRETGAALGLAFDGDADRLGAVDEHGEVLWGDRLLILFAREILKHEPGAAVVAEVKCSHTLFDEVARAGGRPVMWRTGHSLIKAKMKEEKAAIAGEMSGHFFFAHRYLGYDDAIYAAVRLLEIVAAASAPLSSLLADVPKTFTTPELRVDCPDAVKFEVVRRVTERFRRTHEVIDIDGARIVFDGGWGLVRASNTGPVLVLRFEATTAARLAEIRTEVESAVAEARRVP
jgi:phosphomannomutase/phosphoglucomutase